MDIRTRRLVALSVCSGAIGLPACFNPEPPKGHGSTGDTTTGGTTTASTSSASTATTATTTLTSSADTSTTQSPTETTDATDATTGPATESSGGSSEGSTGCPPEATGESGADVNPPILMAAEFTASNTVSLTFSEALTNPVGVVRPEQFRLSYGLATSFPPPPYDTLIYYDLGYLDNPQVPIAVDEIEWSSCARNRIVLHLDGDLTQAVCDRAAAFDNYFFGAGYETAGAMLVHFATSIPMAADVEDEAGNPLAELAPEFVVAAPALKLQPVEYYIYADFPNRDPDLPIPCPF